MFFCGFLLTIKAYTANFAEQSQIAFLAYECEDKDRNLTENQGGMK